MTRINIFHIFKYNLKFKRYEKRSKFKRSSIHSIPDTKISRSDNMELGLGNESNLDRSDIRDIGFDIDRSIESVFRKKIR